MNGSELLASYRKTGSDRAFEDLLRRYTDLVFSVAHRRLASPSLAEEVTQTVFTRLAQAPPKIKSDGELVAWLHRTTVHVSIDAWRSESRRRHREQQAILMQSSGVDDARLWEEMTPHLDEALNQLPDDDRQVVLLRFFERKAMRDIGDILGVSEDAAKMRVSRAVGKLREQFASRGVACTAVILATVLAQRTVEAAPAGLLPKLLALKLAVPVAAAGGISGTFSTLARSKVVLGTTSIAVVGVMLFLLAHRSQNRTSEEESATTPTVAATQTDDGRPDRFRSSFAPRETDLTAAVQPATRFIFRAVDKETGVGLPGAKVRAAYFYAGGIGEGHETQTDSEGNAPIPEPNHPDKKVGLNVFISLGGYVPKAINFHGREDGAPREQYVIELEPALEVGGIVVDEQGQPVADVELEARRAPSDNLERGEPGTDFQTCKVKTDANGRWSFPYVPQSYDEIQFRLTCTNYAVTTASVPVNQPESTNATLVIERGFTIVARITDAEGQPVPRASVKELQNYGYRRLSATTDADGLVTLRGLAVPVVYAWDMTDPKRPTSRRTKDRAEAKTDIVVQANGMAPQMQTVQLVERTNYVNFVLARGNVFRGRVVDESGKTIAGAIVQTDWDSRGLRTFEWTTYTDADGRFEWDSAPAESVDFWIEADGFEVIRDRSMTADDSDHEIKLTRKVSAMAGR